MPFNIHWKQKVLDDQIWEFAGSLLGILSERMGADYHVDMRWDFDVGVFRFFIWDPQRNAGHKMGTKIYVFPAFVEPEKLSGDLGELAESIEKRAKVKFG